ncbi:hypothetical protein C9I89_03790 [Photobacterium lipolyticum]|uniref:DUF8173 domain-containing protein n=2 Tax=Photobacterium lipolyticum TaxID=266810 RepID=A0A2T3N2S5_9GAMM|nr:hypothetical protein C9I89_03790 [Photobacterium lipolyticum]
MNPRNHTLICFFAAVLTLIWGTALRAQVMGETVLIRAPVEHDLYTAGRHIEILAEVDGDLVAAGQVINVTDTVLGDVIAAAEIINLRANVLDDVRAAGRQVIVIGEVGDHMVAAGENVTLESGSRIGSWAWLAGESVRVSGQIGQELKAAARHVIISGEVIGDVELMAEQIEILDGAHLHGDLIWRSEQPPLISDGATIGGRIIERPLPEHMEDDDTVPLAAFIFFAVSLMITGVVIYLLLPQVTDQTMVILRSQPWLCLGLGVLVLITTPLVVILLFVTTIGSLLALVLLACYLVMILVAVVTGIFSVGDLGLRLAGKGDNAGKGLRILSFLIAITLLGLLQLIPIVGGVIKLAVVLFGLGGLALTAYRGSQQEMA